MQKNTARTQENQEMVELMEKEATTRHIDVSSIGKRPDQERNAKRNNDRDKGVNLLANLRTFFQADKMVFRKH